jgi:hypothetical protein
MPESSDAMSRAEAMIRSHGLDGRIDREALRAELESTDAGQTGVTLKFLSIVGGLIASSTLSGFFFSSGLMESPPVMLVSGLLFIFGALWLNRRADHLVMDTFTISIFLMGFVHLAMAMSKLEWQLDLAIPVIGAIALVALAVTRGYMLSFFSLLIASASILFYLAHRKWHEGIHAYVVLWLCVSVWLFYREGGIMSLGAKASRQYPPIRIVAILSLTAGLFFVCNRYFLPYSQGTLWITSLATMAGVLFVADSLAPLFGLNGTFDRLTFLAGVLLLVFPLWFAPAIIGSMLVLLLGFRTGDRTTFALGMLAFLYFTVQYYYDLDLTLLKKSYVMMSTGMLFLGLYLVSNKKLKSLEKG